MEMRFKILIVFFVVSLFCFCDVDCGYTKKREILHKVPKKFIRYCQPQTPCAWMVYDDVIKPEIYFKNTYCECDPRMKCKHHVYRNGPNEKFSEYRCRPVY